VGSTTKYLGEFKFIFETALGWGSVGWGTCFCLKNQRQIPRDTVPLTSCYAAQANSLFPCLTKHIIPVCSQILCRTKNQWVTNIITTSHENSSPPTQKYAVLSWSQSQDEVPNWQLLGNKSRRTWTFSSFRKPDWKSAQSRNF
jgi:hypothetical protein